MQPHVRIAIPPGLANRIPALSGRAVIELRDGLLPWIAEFAEETARDVSILLDNGAEPAACLRLTFLLKMLDAERRWSDGLVSVKEAAALTGKCPETVRRDLRNQKLSSSRSGQRGHYRIRRGDLIARVEENSNRVYDAGADAQDIAKRRREA